MGTNIRQRDDGGMDFVDDASGKVMATVGGSRNRAVKVAKVDFAGGTDTAGGIFAWSNPEQGSIIIEGVVLDITTQSSGACSISVGSAANGTTSSANLLDTQSVAATGQLDNFSNKGAGGKSSGKLTAGQFVTASRASGASAGLIGSAYISYIVV